MVSGDQLKNITSIVAERTAIRSVRNEAPWLPTGRTLTV